MLGSFVVSSISCSKKSNSTTSQAPTVQKTSKHSSDDVALMMKSLINAVASAQSFLFSIKYVNILDDQEMKDLLIKGRDFSIEHAVKGELGFDDYYVFKFIYDDIQRTKVLENSSLLESIMTDPQIMSEEQFSYRAFEMMKDKLAILILPNTLKAMNYDETQITQIETFYIKNQKIINEFSTKYKGLNSYRHLNAFNLESIEEVLSETKRLNAYVQEKPMNIKEKNKLCSFAASVRIFTTILKRENRRKEFSLSGVESSEGCENFKAEGNDKSAFCQYTLKTIRGSLSNVEEYCESTQISIPEDEKMYLIYDLESFEETLELASQADKKYYESITEKQEGLK